VIADPTHPIPTRRWLWLILAAALVIRLALLAVVWNQPALAGEPDSAEYLANAHSLAGGAFQFNGLPEIFRTPGYPAFLAGPVSLGPDGWRVALVIQVLLDVLLVYLTYRLGLMLCGERVALVAAGFHALSAASAVAGVLLLTESIFAFVLTGAILSLIAHFRGGKWWTLALAAALTAAAIYVRPVGVIFVPVAAAVLLWGKDGLARVAGFVGIVILLLGPWVARNYMQTGYLGIATVSDHNLLAYEAAAVEAKINHVPVEQARALLLEKFNARLMQEDVPPGSPAAWRICRQMARDILWAHPALAVREHVVDSLNSLLPAGTKILELTGVTAGQQGTLNVLQTEGVWPAMRHYFGDSLWAVCLLAPEMALLALQCLGILACGVRGVIRRLRVGPEAWLIALTILAFLLVGGPAAMPRFRVPIEPMLDLAAGCLLLKPQATRAGEQ
jgi:4-amino-4-deoxy-L-arabinose transferase-like glycosyltransferase